LPVYKACYAPEATLPCFPQASLKSHRFSS
jgi:hypothetical protein